MTRSHPTAARRRRLATARAARIDALEPRRLFSDPAGGAPADADDQISEAFRFRPHQNTFAAGLANFSITSPGDVQMFEVELFTGVTYQMDVDLVTLPDSVLRLFDAQGQQLAISDDNLAPGETTSPVRESYISYTPATSGRYYLGFSAYPNLSYDPITGTGDDASGTASGSLRYTQTYTPTADPDDSGVNATNVAIGGAPAASTIDAALDVDIYRFTAAAGQVVSFDLDRAAGGTLDAALRLFDAAGDEIAYNDDSGQASGESTSIEPYLEYRFAAAGTYFLGVAPFRNRSYDPATGGGDISTSGSTGAYTLRLIDGDANANVGALTSLDNARIDAIDFPGDVDNYQFTVAAGAVIGLDYARPFGTTPAALAGGVRLELFDASFNLLASSDDSGERPGEMPGVGASEPFLEYRFATAGTYSFDVSSRENRTGSYAFFLGAGDANDQATAEEAIRFNPAAPADGAISFVGDVDLYRFDLATASRYGFDLDTTALGSSGASGLDSLVRLFDANGVQLAANDDAAAPGDDSPLFESYLERDLPAGTYYVGVSYYGNVAYNAATGEGDNLAAASYVTGSYALRLTNVGVPVAAAASVAFQTRQSLSLTFDEPLAPASVSAADFVVRNLDTSAVIPASRFALALEANNTTATLTYDLAFGTLPDGDYEVGVLAGAVTDVAGNAVAAAQARPAGFFLAGDANRDRAVNFSDLVILAQNYGTSGRTFGQGNLDYSAGGTVGFSDLVILAQNYNRSLVTTATRPAGDANARDRRPPAIDALL